MALKRPQRPGSRRLWRQCKAARRRRRKLRKPLKTLMSKRRFSLSRWPRWSSEHSTLRRRLLPSKAKRCSLQRSFQSFMSRLPRPPRIPRLSCQSWSMAGRSCRQLRPSWLPPACSLRRLSQRSRASSLSRSPRSPLQRRPNPPTPRLCPRRTPQRLRSALAQRKRRQRWPSSQRSWPRSAMKLSTSMRTSAASWRPSAKRATRRKLPWSW
mmetsp:Transcript_23588/g.54828  ORF Transcript_23588/g.54828 Transcript_23588/m.54828 type:complete len:211 (+) Transcript_23588:794-1426(+)